MRAKFSTHYTHGRAASPIATQRRQLAHIVARESAETLAAALTSLVMNDRVRQKLARRAIGRARSLPTWADSEARFVRAVRREPA
jgi:hypothetical protein